MSEKSTSRRVASNPLQTELILGLVGAVGTDFDLAERILRDRLARFRYDTTCLRLSSLLKVLKLKTKLVDSPESARVKSHMKAGTEVRKLAGAGGALAAYAISVLHRGRPVSNGESGPFLRHASVLRSLKHPDEVSLLRQVYGPGFFLIGLYSTETERLRCLSQDKNMSKAKARALIRKDEAEDDLLGQRTRDTFELADVFVRLDPGQPEQTKTQIWRFLDLVFGSPVVSPNPDEQGMYFACAASLRSASLARQVGAALVSSRGELLGVGCNDVPCSGGGLYWPGDRDCRDHCLGKDSNDLQRQVIVEQVLSALKTSKKKRAAASEKLARTKIAEITEWGRAVHGEMEALLSCLRVGSSPVGGTLYATTFPCHNCARHIIAAGVTRVVYVEPYPKSHARELHADAMALEEADSKGKVLLEPFIGLGPRHYVDFFSMGWSTGYRLKRKHDGRPIEWRRGTAQPRVPLIALSYVDREMVAISKLTRLRERRYERKD